METKKMERESQKEYIWYQDIQSYVYFITDDHGHIKVGKANDVWTRLKELQTGNPYKLRILLTVGVPSEKDAMLLEQTLHQKLRFAQMEGEWFHEEPVRQLLSQHYVVAGQFCFVGLGCHAG